MSGPVSTQTTPGLLTRTYSRKEAKKQGQKKALRSM